MNAVEAVRVCFQKYAVFSGRARRSEYWWFQLFYLVVITLVVVLVYTLQSSLPVILIVGLILPALAVSVRRLHDTSRSGWWLLLNLIPFGLGSLVLLAFYCMDSDRAANQYGDSPKGDFGYPTAQPGF